MARRPPRGQPQLDLNPLPPPLDLDSAINAIAALAHERPAFTTDDVWHQLTTPSDGRAIANAIIRAESRHLIRNSRIGAYLRGRQAHRRWLTIWLSVPLHADLADATAYASSLLASNAESKP